MRQAMVSTRPSPCRVLLVDDDPLIRQTLALLLRDMGYAVEEADGGRAALALFDAGPVDLVLTDLQMPGLTGWDVARAVKERNPQVPVVLLTGLAHAIAHDQPERRLVDAILQKPCRLEVIQAVIDRLTSEISCAAA